MSIESKIPEEILCILNAKLTDNSFVDYTNLTNWLNAELHKHKLKATITKADLATYDRNLKDQIKKETKEFQVLLRLSRTAMRNNEDMDGVIRSFTINTLQSKLLKMALDAEEADDAADIHRIIDSNAKLSRSEIESQKFKQEIIDKARKAALQDAADKMKEAAKGATGVTYRTIEKIRKEVLGMS